MKDSLSFSFSLSLFLMLIALLKIFLTSILWSWLADFDMSGLHSANHWSFLRFLLSHAILVTSVIWNLPRERLCLEQILELFWEELPILLSERALHVMYLYFYLQASAAEAFSPSRLYWLFPLKTWMATDAQCGRHINICIYIQLRHLAHVP